MRYAEKEIANYKIIFENGQEFLLDTLLKEKIYLTSKNIRIEIIDALFYSDLIENLYNSNIKKIIRYQTVRSEVTGKDKIFEMSFNNPECHFEIKNNAEETEYTRYYYTFISTYFTPQLETYIKNLEEN